jgi:hypothetical protein
MMIVVSRDVSDKLGLGGDANVRAGPGARRPPLRLLRTFVA